MGARAQLDLVQGGADDLPAMIDRYKPLKKLATGGMAELFLAKQSGLEGFEKVVVIKRILSHLAMDEEFVTMFLDEARIAAKLSHPNIVQIYDLGKAGDSHYIAMEYVSGRNVQHLLAKEADRGALVPVEHACRIVAGVCDGLHYAHSRKDYDGRKLNIVHRDISPQNILVSFAGGVKLVDFGIAKASTQLAQTRAGVLKGKYAYMSPEQVRGAKIDHRSDIFSVGLVMYELLTGHRAFERESSLKTLKAIVQEKPLNPKELNPQIPDAVIKLLSRALEKSPDRRYNTAQDMQLAIEDYLDSAPRKSNNVRISRYMYDLFDDELNAEGGTLVVEGIGEVIVPTGQKGPLKPRVQEEVDHKTLSAALSPAEIQAQEEQEAAKQAGDGPRRRNTAPAARVVREERSVEEVEDDDDDDSDLDDGPSDKTIPVYDLEEYEKRRLKGPSADSPDTSQGDVGAPPSDNFSEDRTVGGMSPAHRLGAQGKGTADPSGAGDPAATDEIGADLLEGARAAAQKGPAFDDDETATVGPGQAAGILAKVAAVAAGGERSESSTGEVNPREILTTGPDGKLPWEAGTVEVSQQNSDGGTDLGPPTSPGGVPGPTSLHSTDAVVGSGGVIRGVGQESGGIRPAAAAPAGIRPAANAAGSGIRPAARPGSGPTSPPAEVGPPMPDPTPVTRDRPATTPPGAAPALNAPSGGAAPGGEAITAPVVAKPAKAAKKTIAGLPMWMVLAGAGAMLFFFLAAVGMIVAVVVLTQKSGPTAADVTWVSVKVRATPPDAEILVDGEPKQASAFQVPAGKHTITLKKAGYVTSEEEVDIPANPTWVYAKTLNPDGDEKKPSGGGKGSKKGGKKK